MSAPQEELEPLGDLAASALAAERARVLGANADGEARARLFGRVLVTVGVGTAATAALAGAAGTAKAATGAGAGMGAGAGVGTAAASASVVPIKAVVGIAALAFVVGTGTGAAVHRTVTRADSPAPVVSSAPATRPAPALPKVDPTASSEAPPTPSDAPRPSAVPTPSFAPTAAPPPLPSSSAGGASDADLAAERSLVDRARSALARGDTTACMEAVAAHQKRFPRGRLGEERELTAIQALARDNQTEAARARAGRFRKTYPTSVFLPSIDRVAPP